MKQEISLIICKTLKEKKNGYSDTPMTEFLKLRWNVSIHRKKEPTNTDPRSRYHE